MAKILSQVGEHRPRPRKTVRGCKQKTFSCSNTKKFKKRSVTSKVRYFHVLLLFSKGQKVKSQRGYGIGAEVDEENMLT